MSVLQKTYTFFLHLFALIGVTFVIVFFLMRFDLLNVRGTIDARNEFFLGTTTPKELVYNCVDHSIEKCPWNESPEWAVVKGGLEKDAEVIARVAGETGVPARLIAAAVIPEQIRFFTSEREIFKRYFEPLKILGSLSQFSLGVSGIKQETAENIERFANDTSSPFYRDSKFAKLLGFPNSYDNNWNSFEDVILGKQIEMPTNLILYNINYLRKDYDDDQTRLFKIIWKYNDINYNYEKRIFKAIIETDFTEKLETNKIGTIFHERPFQYGLRGDIPLWDALENYFKELEMPADEKDLIDKIHAAMIDLTGKSTQDNEDYSVKEYNRGGMSGGRVCADFWERRGIPLFIGRYREIKN